MKKKNIFIISLIFISVVLIGFITATILFREKPGIPSKATGLSCPIDGGSCTWSSDDTATSFNVKVIDQTTGVTILNKTVNDKKVTFTPIGNHIYKCVVVPVNSCGNGPEASDTSTCNVLTGTPSPSSTITPTLPPGVTPSETPEISLTPTPTGEISETPSPTPSSTPTDTPTSTPTPTEEASPTPTPTTNLTETPGPSATPTETPDSTVTLTGAPSSTPKKTNSPPPGVTELADQTGVPTIPASGTPAHWIFVLIPLAIILVGLIF